MNEILKMFKENFPYVSREEDDLMKVLGNEVNVVLTRRTPDGRLMGCAVVNKNTILLLVVDKGYRGQGIGDGLLRECEAIITSEGGPWRGLRLSHARSSHQQEICPSQP